MQPVRTLIRFPCRLAGWLMLSALLGGCITNTTPTDYFLLEALAPPARAAALQPEPVVGVGPIRFPRYVDRPQMVVALPGGQLRLRDNERWADNLRDNFSRVLAEDLAARVPTDRILVHPWSRSDDVDVKLTMRVNEFHLTETGTALLDVRWELYGKQGLLSSRKSRLRSQAEPNTPAMGATALSRTVDLLSRECAEAIRRALLRGEISG
jgi:uncharacterized lipoprotein YmbA